MGKSSINGPFSMAMLNNQRVNIEKSSIQPRSNQLEQALQKSTSAASQASKRWGRWAGMTRFRIPAGCNTTSPIPILISFDLHEIEGIDTSMVLVYIYILLVNI